MPINGIEAYFRPDRAKAKAAKNQKAWHLCLFAKNLTGWHNLLYISSVASAEVEDGGGFYDKPCLDWELLGRYHEGLIATSACFQSWLSELIKGGDSVAVSDYIGRMRKLFGDDFWIEIMPHDFDGQRLLNIENISIAKEFGVGVVATNDAHFPYKEWAETHRIAKMMGAQSSFEKARSDVERGKADYLSELNPTLYLAHEEEMRLWFEKFHPQIAQPLVDEAIANTLLVQQSMSLMYLDKNNKLPKVTDSPDQAEKILRVWIEEGFAYKVPEGREQEYRTRLEEEFATLKDKGVLDYFVLVGDVVRWAKMQGIHVGLGRGSAAGCLVSYLIGITAIDPINYGLLFERFLNPQRKGLPDIDIDFQSDRRHEIKAYIASKHWCEGCGIDHDGSAHVADIITHARFQPKSVLQDLCRVYDIPYMEAQAVTDTIDIRQDDEETTLEELVPLNVALQEFRDKYPEIWEHALRLEGSVKNAGKHAAGIVITPKPVAEYMALERGKKGDLVTSWSDAADFPVVSDYGFVKLDALGIKGLQRHAIACELIYQRTGDEIDLNELPVLRDPALADQEVMEGFRQGYTIGIFQFGGRGITGLLKSIKPDSVLDVTAANALYRPGPMGGGVTWDYAKRKHDPELVEYWHDSVAPILKETYGLVAYQEQVMEISKQLGNFTGGEADDLRKAMGKLYRIKGGKAAKEYMARFEGKWFTNAPKLVGKEIADIIWKKMLEFGHYGFNKSHSASYALQAYQDMWLKIHYPAEFYAAILTLPSGSTPKEKQQFISSVIREARSRGVQMLPPDVNISGKDWTVHDGKLRYGLTGIKGIGTVAANEIIQQQPFDNYADFLARTTKCHRGVQDALVESGAFDCWGGRFEASGRQIIAWEKDRLGISLTLATNSSKYSELIRQNIYTTDEIAALDRNALVIVGGEITEVVFKTTAKGNPYANVTISFELNEWKLKLWQDALRRFNHLLNEGEVVMVNGRKDEWKGYVSIRVIDMTLVNELAEQEEEVVA